jgi:AraC-like DNA-binding protein
VIPGLSDQAADEVPVRRYARPAYAARMPYVERLVAPGVEVWQASGRTGATRILPDACIDLILEGDRLLVAGPDTSARLHVGRGSVVTGVRLHAGRAPALLGLPADELTDRCEPLDTIWPAGRARRLTESVGSDPLTALEHWSSRATTSRRSGLVRDLLATGHTVSETADRLGCSTRQLQRHTRAAFGYGPQHLARVLRLDRLTRLVDTGRAWAELAYAGGFSDQAHLSREVRDLVGITPTQWREERVRSVQDVAPEPDLASAP